MTGNPFDKLANLRDQLPAGPTPDAQPKTAPEKKAPKLFDAKVVVRKERKGHGGKTVTVVDGVLAHAREDMAGEMKRALGCGARIEDGSIVLQGDLMERAAQWLEKKGAAKVIRGSK